MNADGNKAPRPDFRARYALPEINGYMVEALARNFVASGGYLTSSAWPPSNLAGIDLDRFPIEQRKAERELLFNLHVVASWAERRGCKMDQWKFDPAGREWLFPVVNEHTATLWAHILSNKNLMTGDRRVAVPMSKALLTVQPELPMLYPYLGNVFRKVIHGRE